VLIGDGERITVHAVLRPKVTFEVRGPEVIRVHGRGGDHARMLAGAAPPPLLHQAAARQEIAGRADRRQVHAGVPRRQPLEEFLGPPARMLTSSRADQVGDVGRDPMRAPVRRAATVAEGCPPAGVETIEPLVACLPN
jgi:hypothetical protein